MVLDFPWPYSQGEWLAWGVAAITVLLGLAFLLAPRFGLRLLGFQYAPDNAALLAVARSLLGGFHLGVALSAILFAQPFIYFALGLGWAFAAFGRLISLMADRGNTVRSWIGLAVTIAFAALPIAYALGFLP